MKNRQKVIITSAEGVLLTQILKQEVSRDVLVVENQKNITHMHSYGGLSLFFQALATGKLLGTRCFHCSSLSPIWLPPRVDCPDCWGKMAWWQVDTHGATVYSHSTTNYPGAGFKGTVPCPLISLQIPGVCTNMMSYLSEFGEGEPYIGMLVRPVFRTENPTRTILDLSWVPVD